jgi:hypothetical protein
VTASRPAKIGHVTPVHAPKQVGPGAGQQVMAGRRARGFESDDQLQSEGGPSAMATATALHVGKRPRATLSRRDLAPSSRVHCAAAAIHSSSPITN